MRALHRYIVSSFIPQRVVHRHCTSYVYQCPAAQVVTEQALMHAGSMPSETWQKGIKFTAYPMMRRSGCDRATNSASSPSSVPALGASSSASGTNVGCCTREPVAGDEPSRQSCRNWSRTGLAAAQPAAARAPLMLVQPAAQLAC